MKFRHTSLLAFYTALFTTAFAIAGLASDSWFTKGSMYSMGAKPSMNIGLLKSTWHYTCPNKTEPTSNIVSASHNAAALFAVTVVFGILTTITCLLCGISINSFRVRALSIVSSTLFFIFYIVAFGVASGIKLKWEHYFHTCDYSGHTQMGGAWLVSLLGVMTVPCIPIFIASDAFVDGDYEKLENATELDDATGATAPKKF